MFINAWYVNQMKNVPVVLVLRVNREVEIFERSVDEASPNEVKSELYLHMESFHHYG